MNASGRVASYYYLVSFWHLGCLISIAAITIHYITARVIPIFLAQDGKIKRDVYASIYIAVFSAAFGSFSISISRPVFPQISRPVDSSYHTARYDKVGELYVDIIRRCHRMGTAPKHISQRGFPGCGVFFYSHRRRRRPRGGEIGELIVYQSFSRPSCGEPTPRTKEEIIAIATLNDQHCRVSLQMMSRPWRRCSTPGKNWQRLHKVTR